MGIRFEHATFTASEVEAFAGRSIAQQKNDRRAGYTELSGGGWTRTSVRDLAQIQVVQMLADRGVPPATSYPIGKSAAGLILVRAFSLPGVVDDPLDLAKGEEPIKASQDAHARRYLVVSGKEHTRFEHLSDIRSFFEDRPPDDGSAAAVIVLDLWRLAQQLVQRVGKPLTRVVPEDA